MNAHDQITSFLCRHRRTYIASALWARLCVVCALTFFFWSILAVLFAVFPWIGLPLLWDASALAAALSAAGFVLDITALRRPSLGDIAAKLERTVREPHQSLGLSLELSAQPAPASTALVEWAAERAASSLGAYPRQALRLRHRAWTVWMVGALCCFAACCALARPNVFSYWDIGLRLTETASARVLPGSCAVPRNASCRLQCIPARAAFPSCRLTLQTLGSVRRLQRLLKPLADGSFAFEADSCKESFSYLFTLGNSSFGPETITVVALPELRMLQITLFAPSYTGLPPQALAEGRGSYAAYRGTRAHVRLASHFGLAQVRVVCDFGDTVALSIVKGAAEGDVIVSRPMHYTFSLVDSLSQRSDSLPSFAVDILPDYPPTVRIVKPAMNRDLTPEQAETLWVEGSDDLGIRRLVCQYRRSTDPPDSVRAWDLSPGSTRQTSLRVEAAWDLAALTLYPGDTVYYWARIEDTWPYQPPHVALSDTFFFRVPTFAEIHERIALEQSGAQKSMEAVRSKQSSMERQLEQLARSAAGKDTLSWEDKKILADVKSGVRSQVDSLNKAVSSLEQAVKDLRKDGSLGQEIVDKMDSVRAAIEDLVKRYGDSLLFEPPKPNETVSWRDMQKSVENLRKLLPELAQQLDNTLRYLEMIRRDQELAKLAGRSERLAQEQASLLAPAASPPLRQEQELSREIEKLLHDIDSTARDTSNPAMLDKQDIPSAEQAAALQAQMRSALSQKNMPSSSAMGQMTGALQSLSQELQSLLSTAMMAQLQKDRDQLTALAGDVLDLSAWQDSIASQPSLPQENLARTAAQEQALKEALQKSMQKLDSMRMVSPRLLKSIGDDAKDAMAAMDGALAYMSGGFSPGPSDAPSGRLNNLARTVLSAADAMQKQCQGSCPSGAGGGLVPGLRRLSGAQAAINAATAQMLRQMLSQGDQPGGEALGGASAQARAQAQAAQEQIARELKRLADQYGNEAGSGLDKRVKDLEDEAHRLASMLKEPSPSVRDHQDRFLVRLLQTTLSMHKQDEGKEERKSRSATVVYDNHPVAGTGHGLNGADTYYRIRTRALAGNYPDAYRLAVQAYLDSLGVLFLKE